MIVVSDTSVVLNLTWLHQESLLLNLFSKVLVPSEVRREFIQKANREPRFTGFAFPTFIEVVDPGFNPPLLTNHRDLDAGKVAALALAIEHQITDVLIDERAARAVARSLGLHVSGLLGILIQAKDQALISSVRASLDALISGARFWIDPRLRERVLRRAGEWP